MTTRVLVLNDTHIGNVNSVMPTEVEVGTGDENRSYSIQSNNIQRTMYDKWTEMCSDNYDVGLLLGDMTEGTNYRENGIGNWTNDMSLQIDTCVDMLEKTGITEWYGVQGSPYHTGLNESADYEVLDKLGGTFDDDMILGIDDILFYLKHVTSYSSVPHSRSTGLNRDMVNTEIHKNSYGDIDVHLRAHVHYHHFVGWEGKLGLINPCWKHRDQFLRRGNAGSADIGYTVFTVDGDEYNWKTECFKLGETKYVHR